MTTSKAIVQIYQIFEKSMGKNSTKNAISDCIWVAISRLEDESLPITEENIDKLLTQFAEDYNYASQKNAV